MKKVRLLLLLLVTLSLGVLAACGDDVDPQDIIDQAQELVQVGYATGDSATNVTQNVTLPSAQDDVTLTWSSSNPAVISAAGVVTRGAADVNVVLTATLTFEEVSVTKTFNLTVKGDPAIADAEAVATAKAALAITYATGDSAAAVTDDVTLPLSVSGVTVSWETSNAAYITAAGLVTRGMANQTVTLTATLTKGTSTDTKVFTLTVLFDQNLVDADAVANAKASLEVGFATGEDQASVTQDLTLPTQVGDVTVSWATTNAAAVSAMGMVTQTSANQMVTLTATLTLGDQTDTKVFELTVLLDQALLDQELVDAAALNIAIGFAAEENAAGVSQDVTLPTMVGEVAVAWESSHPDVISNAGVVVQGIVGQTVTLTATLTKGDAVEEVPFILYVLLDQALVDAEKVAAAAALEALYADTIGNELYEVMEDLDLVAQINDYQGMWESSNEALVGIDGTVVRPVWTEDGGDTAILTATITVGDDEVVVTFFAFVKSLDKTLEQTLTEALAIATAFPVVEGITTNQTFPATITYEDVVYNVTWVSDKPQFLANDGTVTRPAIGQPDELVTVTVSITVGETTVSKDITFNVFANESGTPMASIGDAIVNAVDGDFIMIPGLLVIGKTSAGLYLADSTGIIYVYDSTVIYSLVNVGDVVDVTGEYDVYYNAPQLRHSALKPLTVTPSNAVGTRPEPIDTLSLTEITQLPTPPGSGTEIHVFYTTYRVTAKVIIDQQESATSGYNTWLVEPTYEGNTIIQTLEGTTAKSYFAPTINIYYATNKAAFADLHGKTVVVDIMMLGYRTDRLVWYAGFIGTAADIEIQIADDAEAVALAKSQLPSFFNTGYDAPATVDLPSSIAGTTITYASESPYFDELTGEITIPDGIQETVTVTATITRGAVTDTLVITFTVGEYPVLTIADALLVTTGTVRVQGVVLGLITYRTYAIQDETGTIAVYSSNADWMTYIGKEIDLVGTRSAYKGLQQINPTTVVLGAAVELPPFPNIDAATLDDAGLTPYVSQFVTRTGLEVVSVTNPSFSNLEVLLKDPVTMNEVKVFWDSRTGDATAIAAHLNSLTPGMNVSLIGIAVNFADYARFTLVDASQIIEVLYVPETDQEKVDQAALELEDLPTEINAATTLTLPLAGSYATTVAWTSSHPEVISEAGVVVVPETGVTVTLTATITLNAATATRTFTILVQENILTVLEARNAALDELVIVEGIVTAVATEEPGNGDDIVAFIQDGTAGIYLYKIPSTYASSIVVGNMIRVYGTRAVYQNLVQIKTITNVVLLSADNVVAPVVVTDPAELPAIQGQLVEVSGYLREVVTSGSNFYLVTDQGQFVLRLASSSDLNAAASSAITTKLYNVPAGTMITAVAALGQFSSTMQVMLFDEAQVTLGAVGTEQQLGEAALGNLVLPEASAEQVANLTLPTTGLFGTTVSWASDNEAVISTAGVVTRPAEGQPNAVVTLTYTVVNGATTIATNTIQFTVLAEAGSQVFATDLFISEYMEGSSNNKYIEIYNGTGATVDLSIYKVNLYGNGSATATQSLTLTGTLAHGEVYVIANSSANATILAAADTTSAVTFYNGDDAVGLLKNDVVIDVIGVIGTDPGSNWPVNEGFTNEFTLVRAATVTGPNAVFTEAEWVVYPQDTVTDIGVHTMG